MSETDLRGRRVADGEGSDSRIRRQAFRNLAVVRTRRLSYRFVFYAIGTAVAASFVPPAWGLPCIVLIALTEWAERRAALAYLADGRDGVGGRQETPLIAANIATCLALTTALAVIWAFADPSQRIIAFCFLATAVLGVSAINQHIASLLMLRQSLYTGTGVVMSLRDLVLAGPNSATDAAMQLFSVTTFAAMALLMSLRSAKVYREQLEREMQLASARDAAEKTGAAKSAFIATVSHELRTPLNGVLGMTQTLLGAGLTPEQRRHVEVILESGRTLNALLTDILDYSKLDAGKLAIEPADEDPRRTIDEVARLYGPVAAGKRLTLNVSVAPEVAETLVFDAVRVRQCASNLVSNAIKFTESGSVDLSLSAAPAAPGPDGQRRFLVTVRVTDTGIGIAADRQKHMFQPFAQADGTISRRYGGTGLGLSITRQLAESMGGGVTLRSAPGEGSEFQLTFLADEAPGTAGRAGALADLADRRVLVVDDVESNRLVMRLFLQPLGVEVVEASDGAAALSALTSGNFDAAFLDLHLPGIGGAEIAARVRRGEGGRDDLPLLAVTADSADSGIDLGDGGFDGVITKPVDPHQLQGKLISAILRRSTPVPPDPPTDDPAPPRSASAGT